VYIGPAVCCYLKRDPHILKRAFDMLQRALHIQNYLYKGPWTFRRAFWRERERDREIKGKREREMEGGREAERARERERARALARESERERELREKQTETERTRESPHETKMFGSRCCVECLGGGLV